MFAFYHKASGLTAITAIWERGRVNGLYIFNITKLKIPLPSMVHGMSLYTKVFKMTNYLKIGNNYGPRAFGYGFYIQNMVLMCMGDQNIIGFKLVYIDMRCIGIPRNEWIYKNMDIAYLYSQTGMSVKRNFHF